MVRQATLATLEKICWALDVTPGDLVELIDDRSKAKGIKTPKQR